MTIRIFGEHDDATVRQLENCVAVEDGADGVLCADGHLGYSMPIGGVVAYREHLSPSGVGFDVACGNKAARTTIRYDDIAGDLPRIMDEVFSRISFGVGRKDGRAGDHPVIGEIRAAAFEPQRELAGLAASQLGTVGAGNHYVDLFRDEADDRIWVGVHFGSRGFGHKTASGFLALAAGEPFGGRASEGEMMSPPVVFPAGSGLGEAYAEAMALAGRYAYAGRDVVVDEVLRILGTTADLEIHNNHNFCVPGDAIVQTPAGPKYMRDVRPGDQVYAFDPDKGLEPATVTDHWNAGRKPVLTLSTSNRVLRCSPDHLVLTVECRTGVHPDRPWLERTNGAVCWRRAEQLRRGDIVVCASQYGLSNATRGADVARLAGAFLGDGWQRQSGHHVRGYSVGLAIGGPGELHVARYLGLCRSALPSANWKDNAPGAFGLSCSSKAVHDRLVELGVAGTSHSKRVPGWVYCLPCAERLAFLAGYIDADGSVAGEATSNHGRATISSVNEELVAGVREVAVSSGLRVSPTAVAIRTTNYGRTSVARCVLAADAAARLPLWHDAKSTKLRNTTHRRTQGLARDSIGYVDLPRDVMCQRVRSVELTRSDDDVYDLTVDHPSHSFVCDGVVTHNCWREIVAGAPAWVVRKGATPAFPGQRGFVGATMGEPAVILEGVDSDASREALYSTVHGAGRAMSRTKAAGKLGVRMECSVRDCDFWVARKDVKPGTRCPRHPDARLLKRRGRIRPGAIDFATVRAELAARGIELRGGAADEAPGAYKRLDEVLAHHAGTVRILHRLIPIGVAMAPAETFDPYKD